MSREKDEKNTLEIRNRILDAAEKLFEERGFDATGIAEIAVQAGITKSLIYYYFKNKDDLLAGIFERFMEKTLELKSRVALPALEDLKKGGAKKLIKYFVEDSMPFVEAHKSILKIALVEEMKSNSEGPLFASFKENMTAAVQYFDRTGMSVSDPQSLSAYLFFMISFPLIGYVVLGEEWCRHTGMKHEDLKSKITLWQADLYERYFRENVSQAKPKK